MQRIIDLTTPITTGHFRWPVELRRPRSHEDGGGIQSTWAGWGVHGFSHVDTPRHFDPHGFTTDALALEQVVGEAAILDVSHVEENAPITDELLAAAGGHVRAGDIALVRTDWDARASIHTPEFWTQAPYMTAEAAQWLFERKVKAVAYDFPQDYCIRHYVLNDRKPQYAENVTHTALLVKGVVMFEYLRNFRAIGTPRTLFIGLPLKLENADGAPVRAIALQL